MHPEADAFLDAIFDHPDDDTPRLVYADWLQEHGQEDYAQFIRLSIRAKTGDRKPPDERKRLRSERRPFWAQGGGSSAWCLPGYTGNSARLRSRGLCNAVVVHGNAFPHRGILVAGDYTP